MYVYSEKNSMSNNTLSINKDDDDDDYSNTAILHTSYTVSLDDIRDILYIITIIYPSNTGGRSRNRIGPVIE